MEEHQKETQIPVFTVWKNNAILKNIFLINSPPPSLTQARTQTQTHEDFEETLLVGRHPDCDIRLEHPSISRFHLRIHSLPSSNLLFLTDLSSVHGTWLSGKRINSDVRTRMNESDTLRIGGSSRVYKLQWIPFSQAYDVSNPFVPPLDFVEPEEDDNEEDEIIKDESSLGWDNEEVQVVDSVSKGLELGVLCDDDKLVVEEVVPKAEEKDMVVENECVGLEDYDMEGLMALFLDEKPELFAGVKTPPDPPAQQVNSELHMAECAQTMDSVLEALVPLFMGENWEWVGQDENYMACPTEDQYHESMKHEDMESFKTVLEDLDASGLGENSVKLVQPSDLPVSEDMACHMTLKLGNTTTGDTGSEPVTGILQVNDKIKLQEEHIEKVFESALSIPEDKTFDVTEKLNKSLAGERGSEFVNETIQNEDEILQQEEDIQDGMWSFWSESLVAPTSSLATEGGPLCTEHSDLDIEIPHDEIGPGVLTKRKCSERVNVYQNSSVKDHNMSKLWSFWSGNMGVESSVCSSLSDAGFFSESENILLGNDCQSPPLSSITSTFESPLITTSDQDSASNIWSRRGKLQSAPQILTSRTEEKIMRSDQKVKDEPISRVLFHVEDDQDERELYTPDKENFTPETHRSIRKLAMLEEVKNSSPAKSSILKMTGSPRIYYEDSLFPSSDKENDSPITSLKQKTARRASGNRVKSVRRRERKGERMPFQSLLADSPQKSNSETCLTDAAVGNKSSVAYAKASRKTCLPDKCSGGKIHKWSMLVDTTTLLNKESRKALQLLEGLKGTQLIIPKIVIRDLGCLKRQTSFFRRNTEVSLALGWIEDCMVRAPWWIHVQNSTEEEQPVAPTPPASPCSQVSCGTTGSFGFSTLESQPQLLSPTVDDHVLDYALSFKRNKNDGQLVLLSNDVTMKIKAMAEGIICETAEEFRESLVNPFSERFLWADSSPRGQTWSCSDDIVLREKFYPSSLKNTPKAMENVKGLKLILLHNSEYYERLTTFVH